jgi:sulfoxide reductase heme-binding subunit YedZ
MTLWYIARAAGIAALIALTISVALGASGASSSTRTRAGIARRFTLQRIHLAAALTAVGLLVVHLLSLALDAHTGMSTSALVLPMASAYRPVAVSLGVLAMYTVVLVALTGAARGRLAGSPRAARRWRSVHAFAYLGWTLAIGHGVFAGTDTGRGPMPLVYAACITTVAAAVAVRLRREDMSASAPLAVRRQRIKELVSAARR